MIRIACLIALSALLAACGGGGDDSNTTAREAFAPAGRITNVEDDGSIATVGMRARLTSVTYTNEGQTAVAVRIDSAGTIALAGSATAYASQEFKIDADSPQSFLSPAVAGQTVSASHSKTVTLPAGSTIVASISVGFEPTGIPVELRWSDFRLTLAVTP